MNKILISCWLLALGSSSLARGQSSGTMAFTVSMDQPNTHYYHVEFRCDGLRGAAQDFKMPVWMPGYYRIMDYSKDVIHFKAVDSAGRALPWAKTNKNTWHVETANAPRVTVSYDVYAFTVFVGNNYLDDQRGYIVGPGTYMHVAGMINHPATVTFKPYKNWSVANGLDPVPGQPNTFSAPDFDLLYDCPVMFGNFEQLHFDVKGVPHTIVLEGIPAGIDRDKIVADFKRIVTTATELIGDIPYKHYTFLCIGKGAGGVEHLTSAAMLSNGDGLVTQQGYRGWLGFASHEYFHTFNIKRIRPIALGPFDYDRENYTNMLWVSEGFTSYFGSLIVERAGLTSRDQYLSSLSSGMARLENGSGHLFQSAAQSSMDTWITGGRGGGTGDENAVNTTISYYSKGGALGPVLDFKIRNETMNQKSLDTVMQTLYKEFYKEKQRGFTDQEFREVCERIAGTSLAEFFDYVYTTKDVDFAKYFAYAGLKLDTELRALPEGYLGADMAANASTISRIEVDSPASASGLSAQDQILAVDGIPMGNRKMEDVLKSTKPGQTLKLLVAHANRIQEINVVLGTKMERSFKITPVEKPTPLQAAILNDWLKTPRDSK
jgi:predicted metalloprotease with PDZ domain